MTVALGASQHERLPPWGWQRPGATLHHPSVDKHRGERNARYGEKDERDPFKKHVLSPLVQRRPLDHGAHFNDVRWELIPKLQAHAQRFDEAFVLRFRPPVNLHEIIFMLLQTVRTICHGTLHWACSKGLSQSAGKRFKCRCQLHASHSLE